MRVVRRDHEGPRYPFATFYFSTVFSDELCDVSALYIYYRSLSSLDLVQNAIPFI